MAEIANVTFRGRHIEVPARTQEHVRKKLSRLSRHLPNTAEVLVEVRREGAQAIGERYSAQITLDSNGTYLRAEESGPNLHAALDTALDILTRRVDRFKEKRYRQPRRLISKAKAAQVAPEDTIELDSEQPEGALLGKIGRVKTFPIKPMSTEEAIEQMELLGHQFFLFLDADAQQYALLYRRSEGDYGLIIPQ